MTGKHKEHNWRCINPELPAIYFCDDCNISFHKQEDIEAYNLINK